MFEIRDVHVLVVNNHVSVAGKKHPTGFALPKVGEFLTDGEAIFKIVGIPLASYKSTDAMKENISLLIEPGEYDPAGLNGKTLTTTA